MSKKTFFKRIAVTAIAALGFGSVGANPGVALVSSHTMYIGASSTATTNTFATTIGIGETATAVVAHSFLASATSDSVTVTALVAGGNSGNAGNLKLVLTDSSTSLGSSTEPAYYSDNTGVTGTTKNLMNRANTTNLVEARTAERVTTYNVSETSASGTKSINTTLSLRLIAPTAAGTYSVVVTTEQSTGSGTVTAGPSVTWTVTVTAADTTSASNSTTTLRNGFKMVSDGGSGTIGTADSTVVATRLTSGTSPAATIWVKQNNSAGTAAESITVSVSGPAFVNTESGVNSRPTSGTALTVKYDASTYGYTPIFVWSTGTAGVATITLSFVGSGLTFTEKVTFRGLATTLKVDSVYKKTLRAGGYADQDTVGLFLSDANGVGVPGATIQVISSATAVVATELSGACTDLSVASGDAYAGYYDCTSDTTANSTSGQTATLTFRTQNLAVTTATEYLSTQPTHAVTLGGSVSTVTITTDKATYEPGEKMVITFTAKDSAGNPVYDGISAPTGIVINKSVGGTVTMNTYYGGVSTSQKRNPLDSFTFVTGNEIFAPNASGKFTITYTYGTYSEKVATATATVSDDAATAAASAATDAALEAIDAANAATDAANLAAEAADAATVAAEEARDAADAATAAVEALATEVATLMAALKAQITTLANTVAKIAKKVKA